MNRFQDIKISDANLKAEFITKFFDTDFSGAFAIINNNPQLDSKTFLASVMNDIAAILSLLQNNFQNGVIDYLSSQITNFQTIIDNYKLKGVYDAQTTYRIYNFVTYNDKDYLYINSTASSGNLPTNTTYWLELGLQGAEGGGGIDVILKYNWDSSLHYEPLDIVYYNNTLWVAKVANSNVAPSNGATWEVFVPFDLVDIYSNSSAPTGDNLYNGLIWLEMLTSLKEVNNGNIL